MIWDTVLLQCPLMPRWLPSALQTGSIAAVGTGVPCPHGPAPAGTGQELNVLMDKERLMQGLEKTGSPSRHWTARQGSIHSLGAQLWGWVCWWAAAPHSARQAGQQAQLQSQGAPRLWAAPCTNQLHKAQGETRLEHHFVLLKLPTSEVTCVSKPYCSGSLHPSSLSSAGTRPGAVLWRKPGRTVSCWLQAGFAYPAVAAPCQALQCCSRTVMGSSGLSPSLLLSEDASPMRSLGLCSVAAPKLWLRSSS